MNINILLIGKYPPVQGGIAAKTYWLYEQLKTKGYNIRIVTAEINNYTIEEVPKDKSVRVVSDKEIPWHLPYSELIYDRLLNKSLDVVKEFAPDIIETNYLWPFCSVASYLAEKLSKPLIIRHAGSDILKFKSDPEFRKIMSYYFNQANKVATNNTSCHFISELCNDKTKVELMQRYIPNPLVFNEKKMTKKYDIMFAGKINYFWQQKGIDLLFSLILARDLKALFIIDGNYVDDIIKNIEKEKLGRNINIINFVHPNEMSKFINQCKSVWCWESEGAIEDFSNLIWEACFCNVKCILNSDRKTGRELDYLIKNFPGLIEMYNRKDMLMEKIEESKQPIPSKTVLQQEEMYRNYIDQNIALYDSLSDL